MPKYITFNTDQAELARAASGAITFDLTHPCIAYTQDWAGAGLIGADRHEEVHGLEQASTRSSPRRA